MVIENLLTTMIFLALSLGCGQIIFKHILKTNNFKNRTGITIFFGFWFASLLIYSLAWFLPGKLNLAIQCMLGISILSLILNRKNIKTFLLHPFFIFLVIFAILINFTSYEIKSWDEFSHWLYSPRYLFTINDINGPKGLFPTYTPLWSLAAIIPQRIITPTFNETLAFIPIYLLSISFVFSLYDFFMMKTNDTKSLWGIFLVFILIATPKLHILPSTFLVENGGYMLVSIFLILVFLSFETTEKKQIRNYYFLALLCVIFAYLVKKPYIILFFAFLIYATILYKKKIISLKKILFSVALFVLFYLSWKLKTQHTVDSWSQTFSERSIDTEFAIAVIISFFKHFFYKLDLLWTAIVMLSFYLSWSLKKKNYFYLTLLMFITYMTSVLLTYITAFSEHEAIHVYSFTRYYSIVYFPFYIILLFQTYDLIQLKNPKNLISLKKIKGWQTFASWILLASVFISIEVYKLSKRDRKQTSKLFVSFLNDSKVNKPVSVLCINQGGDGFIQVSLHYFSLQFPYDISFQGESYSADTKKLGTQIIKDDKMAFLIENSDYILVEKSDAWMNNILKNYFSLDITDTIKTPYVIINLGNKHLKSAPL